MKSLKYAQRVREQLLFRKTFFFLTRIHFVRILRLIFPKFEEYYENEP